MRNIILFLGVSVSAFAATPLTDVQMSGGNNQVKSGATLSILSGATLSIASGGSINGFTSGSSLLYGNGSGGFSNATVGSGLTFTGGALTANVTSVAGRTGAVTLAQSDIAGLTTSSAPTFAGATLTGAITAPDLSFSGTTTTGLHLKSLTTTQKNAASPAAAFGDMVADSTLGRVQVYDGAAWHSHVRLDGDTMTGALTVPGINSTGHNTFEGVTSTGAVGTGNIVYSINPTLSGSPVIGGVTFSSNAATSLNSITAASATDLVLNGGSSGASLDLGQGANGAVTLTAAGTGGYLLNGATSDMLGTGRSNNLVIYNATAGTIQLVTSAATADTAQGTLFFGTTASSVGKQGAAIQARNSGAITTQAAAYLQFYTNTGSGLAEGMRLTSGGNLLIGGTTDITGSGGLKVFGSTASTSTTTGAFQVPNGGVGIGGALNVGGDLAVTGNIYTHGGSLNFDSATNARSTFYQNYYGYNNGFTQLRDWTLGDGENHAVISTNAATLGVTLAGALTVSGTGTSSFASTTDATTASAASVTTAGGLAVAKNFIFGHGEGAGVTSTATAAGTTTLSSTSTQVQVFTGTTTQTITLPAANVFGANIGAVYRFKNRSTGALTINAAGTDTVEGSASATVASGGSLTLISDGSSAWEKFAATGGFSNPMTTLGDIITAGTAGAAQRLAAGSDGQVLTMVSGAPAWAAAGGGSASGTLTLARFRATDNQPPAANYATLDTRNNIAVLDYDDTTAQSAIFVSIIPDGASFTTGVSVKIHWISLTATTGAVVWTAAFENSNGNLTSDNFATGIDSSAATTNATSGIETITGIDFTGSQIGGLLADGLFRLKITRKAADASDTMVGAAQLLAVEIRQR